jgi:dihydrofolate synthase/folylpolyglutamate synthase
VLEVGLGGRLDSTNVCCPEVTAITSISRDHTHLLGSTLAEIAREKAGIFKAGIPVVSGVANPDVLEVVEEAAAAMDAPCFQLDRNILCRSVPADATSIGRDAEAVGSSGPRAWLCVTTPWRDWSDLPIVLAGAHQARNAALAVAIADVLFSRGWSIPLHAVRDGLASVRWPLRIEVVGRQPTVIVDAAHNWASISALLATLASEFQAARRLLIFGTTRDKDVTGMLRQVLPEFDSVILTRYLNNPRAVPVEKLGRMAAAVSQRPVHLAPDPASAWRLAKRLATRDDLICVTGSFFIAAELRELILDQSAASAFDTAVVVQPGQPK